MYPGGKWLGSGCAAKSIDGHGESATHDTRKCYPIQPLALMSKDDSSPVSM